MEILKPKLRFPSFEGDWKSKSIGNIGSFFSGGTPTSTNKSYYAGNIPFIGSGKINAEEVEAFITEDALKNSSAKLVEVGDLLYALYGATSGEVAISKLKGAINQAVLCIRTDENKMFLKSWFEKNKENILNTYLQGGQGNLSSQIVKSLNIKLPLKDEQDKIADFLSKVDIKINQLSKKKELLEQYKKGIMQKIFNQEIRFKDDNGNDYPEWNEKTLDDIAIINMGQSPSSNSYNVDGNGIMLIQGNADIKERKTNPRQWTSQPTKKCEIGDIILTVRAPVGFVSKSIHEACIGRGVCSIKSKGKNNNEFVYQFLLYFEDKWGKLEQGSTFTAVSGSEIKSILLEVPSFQEQDNIATFLSSIDRKINSVNIQLEGTKEFKRGLLQLMFV